MFQAFSAICSNFELLEELPLMSYKNFAGFHFELAPRDYDSGYIPFFVNKTGQNEHEES